MRSAPGSQPAASMATSSNPTRRNGITGRPSGLLVEIEFHLGRFLRAGLGREIRLFLEAENAGKENRRHALDGRVIVAGEVVEAAALDTDAVLGALELGLEFLEVRGGLQVWIIFGDHEQPRE